MNKRDTKVFQYGAREKSPGMWQQLLEAYLDENSSVVDLSPLGGGAMRACKAAGINYIGLCPDPEFFQRLLDIESGALDGFKALKEATLPTSDAAASHPSPPKFSGINHDFELTLQQAHA